MEDLIRIMKALSDETRVRMMKVLLERESLCVCEVMQALEIGQPRASKNLKILKDAGFLKDRKEGLWVHYSVDGRRSTHLIKALTKLLRQSLNDNELILKDRERLSKARKLGEVSKC